MAARRCTGRTAPISSLADRQLFHALRTRVDAVMVGAGTLRDRALRAHGARRRHAASSAAAAGLEPDPLAIVVSGSLDLPADLPLLQDPDSRVVIVTSAERSLEGVRAQVEYLRSAAVDLAGALARLRSDHGVRAILCEGGPHLNASLLAQGLLDELFLTTVPVLAGAAGALSIMDGAPLEAPLGALAALDARARGRALRALHDRCCRRLTARRYQSAKGSSVSTPAMQSTRATAAGGRVRRSRQLSARERASAQISSRIPVESMNCSSERSRTMVRASVASAWRSSRSTSPALERSISPASAIVWTSPARCERTVSWPRSMMRSAGECSGMDRSVN